MKKMMLMFVLCVVASASAVADTVKLPATVESVKSATFSSGSGDDICQVLSVLCKMKNGRDRLFVITKASAGRWLGMGRLANPDEIDFVIDPKATKAVWE
jgi:hypothetical protein